MNLPALRQRTSRRGRDFLAREEGIRLYAYNDLATDAHKQEPKGNATFGVGKLLHHGPLNDDDRHKWGTPERPHSRRYAMRVFRRDLRKYEKAVRGAVGRRLRQKQFDACTSLCFNIGPAGFTTSTVAKALRNDPPASRARIAAEAFLLWSHPSELRPRREREKRLFLEGVYR
jgi:lysozyme